MKDSLTTGLSITRRITVDRDRTIGFLGEDARVYATPALVRDMEVTCFELLGEHLDDGESSVGTRVEVDHLAPTLLGDWAEITATIAERKGRAVGFTVTTRDSVEEVARGAHNRFIVDIAKTKQRLAAKAEKAARA